MAYRYANVYMVPHQVVRILIVIVWVGVVTGQPIPFALPPFGPYQLHLSMSLSRVDR